MKKNNIVGQKFNRLTAIKKIENGYYVFECECGKQKKILKKSVVRETTKSCGCLKMKDYQGEKIGKITVINRNKAKRKSRRSHWNCLCECGRSFVASSDKLSLKTSLKNCGCTPRVLEMNITGKRFGTLTALKRLNKSGKFESWLFKCDCGKEVTRNKSKGLNGTANCGCRNFKDYAGNKYDFLTVLSFVERIGGNAFWFFKCDCGKTIKRNIYSVVKGKTKSCGCKRPNLLQSNNALNWKGGKTTTNYGYVLVFTRDHPNRISRRKNGNGYIFEHRLVMEKKIGRYLLPNENVHHKNGIKDDNRIENLELWVRHQPTGARAEDLVAYAKEVLNLYGKDFS